MLDTDILADVVDFEFRILAGLLVGSFLVWCACESDGWRVDSFDSNAFILVALIGSFWGAALLYVYGKRAFRCDHCRKGLSKSVNR